jgi:predicted PurR-regulated permease PerM
MASERNGFNKYGKPLLILAATIAVIWLAAISMAVLIPFLVGILLAYLLMPLVNWLEGVLPPKGKIIPSKRAIAVALVFIVFTIVLVSFIAYIGAALVTASGILVNKAPEFISGSIDQVKEWWAVLRINLPADIDMRVSQTLSDLGPAAGKFVQDFLIGTLAVIPTSMPTIIGFITLPFFVIFVLNDYEKFGNFYKEIFPSRKAQHTARILRIFGDQMGRYIRFQVIMALVAGLVVTIGLVIMGEEYAPAMGAVTGFTQVIPIIGPFISAAVILIVTLALKPDAILWALLVIVVAQVVVNLIQGWVQEKHFPLHPAVVMVLLTVGGYVASYWGIILALPVGATIWEIYKYFRTEQPTGNVTPDSDTTTGR